jgi:phosphatidylglycerol:prolipoprotein diacylglycerol transferase
MHPYLFYIGDFPIPAFGLMAALGFLAALQYLRRSFKNLGGPEETVFDFALALMIAALVGSRVVYLFVEWDAFVRDPLGMIFSRQGYVFYGGFIFALATGVAFVRMKGIPVARAADATAPAIALGHFFGRLGCYLNGCCFGSRCEIDSVLTRFPKVVNPQGEIDGSPPFWDHLMHGWVSESDRYSLPVYPTQLFEAAGLIALFFVLHRLYKKHGNHWPPGSIFLGYAAGYALLRFCIEFFPRRRAGVDRTGLDLHFAGNRAGGPGGDPAGLLETAATGRGGKHAKPAGK